MDVPEARAVNNLLGWVLHMSGPDGAPVSAERGCEAALMLSRRARGALGGAGVGPEVIALPLGHLVELLQDRQERLRSIAADAAASGVICANGQLDGATTLTEAAQQAQEFANLLWGLANAGYELEGPFQDDCGFYAKPGARR